MNNRFHLLAALLLPAVALAQEGGALSGPTGLLTVPTADVLDEGVVRVGASRHDSTPEVVTGVDNYLFNIGFLPGLELGGRASDFGLNQTNDLSFNAKYAYQFNGGFALAVGGQDIGGEARNFRSRYALATLPWHTLRLTAGYGWGPDVLKGTLGGLEWRPWPFVDVYAEYDSEDVNPGLRLRSPALWGGIRLSANAGYRAETREAEGGFEFTIPLGRPRPPVVQPAPAAVAAQTPVAVAAPLPAIAEPPPPTSSPFTDAQTLRTVLEGLGFESVRTGSRDADVLAVALENRRYNHSAADGIGLALGTIATWARPEVSRIELTLYSWGVPQVMVATSPQAYREFLDGGVAAADLIEVRYTDGRNDGVSWHNGYRLLDAAELVVEPVLRTFVATEYGMLDVGLGARARMSVQMDRGLVFHAGLQAPLLLTDDFRSGENFDGFAPEAGLDELLLQYVHKHSPAWTSLWSAGLAQVYQVDLRVLGMEQLWLSPEGRHRFNAKLMQLQAAESHHVALAGYTWFDATRRYSVGVTAGEFYAGDDGARLDFNRYFEDTIAGLFLKVDSDDSMAGGFQMSIPLTPRRDAYPQGVQVKGPRRWGHSLQTTLNLADGTNALKPLLLYEPLADLDLRRDLFDSNRLGPEWLRGQLPRMREAWQLWGAASVPGG